MSEDLVRTNDQLSSDETNDIQELEVLDSIDAQTSPSMIILINSLRPSSAIDRLLYKVLLTPQELVEYVKQAFLTRSNSSFTTNIFDGQSSHVINLLSFDQPSNSFLYRETWGEDSFLSQNNNQAGVAAERVSNGSQTWRISRSELETVVYAVRMPPAIWGELKGLKYQKYNQDLQQSEFFIFFNIKELRRENLDRGYLRLWLKTGGFQQFIDLILELDQQMDILKASVHLDRSWIINKQMGINPFGLDVAKSFIAAFVPSADLVEVQPLIDGIWELRNPALALQNLKMSASTLLFSPIQRILLTYLGQQDSASMVLPFSTIIAKNETAADPVHLSVSIEMHEINFS
jgi:hypothetical protein